MNVIKRSQYSGLMHSMELDITEEQLRQFESGQGLIQDIFPNLGPDEREFLKTGITSAEWEELFSEPKFPEEYLDK